MRFLLLLPLCLFSGSFAISCYVGTIPDIHVTEGHTYCASTVNLVTKEAVFKGINVRKNSMYSVRSENSVDSSCKLVKDKIDHMFYVNCLCEEDECNTPRRLLKVAKRRFQMEL